MNRLKTKIGTTIGSVLSAMGVGGTTTTFCQTACSISSTSTPLLVLTPLAFLIGQQKTIWWIAFVFFLIFSLGYLKNKRRSKIDLVLILINSGLLGYSLPR